MKKKGTAKFLSALIIFSLTGQIAWVVENMYFNVFIYKMFGASPADISNMVMASAVAATLTTLIMGALSDKLGKRKVFMAGGYILWGISILSFAFIRKDTVGLIFPAATVSAVCVTLVIVMDCVMTFFGSTANDACFNAWLTDSTTHESRGAAEGINAMMPLVAILAVFGGFMGFDLDKSGSWTAIFLIIGIAVTVIGDVPKGGCTDVITVALLLRVYVYVEGYALQNAGSRKHTNVTRREAVECDLFAVFGKHIETKPARAHDEKPRASHIVVNGLGAVEVFFCRVFAQ